MSWQMTLAATLFAMIGGLALIWGAMWWSGWFRLNPLQGSAGRSAASSGWYGPGSDAGPGSAAGAWHSYGSTYGGDGCSAFGGGDGGGCGGDGGGGGC